MTSKESIRVGRTEVDLVGTAFGLVSEAEEVLKHAQARRYAAYLVGVSMQAMASVEEAKGEAPEIPLDELGEVEQLYLEQLGRFGDTALPARELYELWKAARAQEVPVVPIDMDDAAHTDAYVDHVSLWENFRKAKRQRKLASNLGEEPELARFVRGWDRVFFPTRGLRRVEEAREAAMASAIRAEAQKGRGPLLAVVPLERMDGVLAGLRA